jgi:Family of unknown function (DUF6252)
MKLTAEFAARCTTDMHRRLFAIPALSSVYEASEKAIQLLNPLPENGHFSCCINEIKWEAGAPSLTKSAKKMVLTAENFRGKEYFTITLPLIKESGQYKLGEAGESFIHLNRTGERFVCNKYKGSGSLLVEQVSDTTISGQFEFTGENENSQTIIISDGSFALSYNGSC